MKCKRCGGLVLRSADGTSCVNCGNTGREPTRIYVRAVDPQVAQKISINLRYLDR